MLVSSDNLLFMFLVAIGTLCILIAAEYLYTLFTRKKK